MHRVLTDDGTLYLHIDHTAHAYVKTMMDGIFGDDNCRNEIVWCYRGGGVPKKDFARKHDTLLRYTRGNDYTFNKQYVPYSDASVKLVEGRGGVSIDNRERDLDRGASMPDWWTDINSLQTWSPEKTGYPTQKPLALYERIIAASSNEGDVVLDPFCGCATTTVAAEKLGRQWIGIDIWEGAHKTILDRLAKETHLDSGEQEQRRLEYDGKVTYTKDPPIRTDKSEVAAPEFKLQNQQELMPYQKLRNNVIRHVLAQAQAAPDGGVCCAGCGRSLEIEFFELDHVQPRSDSGENYITNRVLLCRPCNGYKGNTLTMPGLHKRNKREGWMHNEADAKSSLNNARDMGKNVCDNWDDPAVMQVVSEAGSRSN